jgi:hypothetical protein
MKKIDKIQKLSKRKLESYKRAEKVCQELRYQIAAPNYGKMDMDLVLEYLLSWMGKTSRIKYKRPEPLRKKTNKTWT